MTARAAFLLALVWLLAACGAPPVVAAPADPPPSTPAWGLLDATCAPVRLAARVPGVTVVVVEASWERLEPAPGAVDRSYAAGLGATVTRCLDAGLAVVLGSGLQYPPAWVRALPGAAPRDQAGRTAATGAVDEVFSGAVATAADDHLRHLLAAVPAARLAGIRLGTSTAGELGYPGPEASGTAFDSWWAFGDAPQHGTDLAAGQEVTPLPGWVPGAPSWDGRDVSPARAREWFRWYSGAVVRAVAARAATLRAAGYAGPVHVPAPGRGVLPADLDAAVAVRLATAVRDGALRRGLDYVDGFPALAAALPGAVVDVTGVDDATAVVARGLTPTQDRCTPGDAAAITTRDPVLDTWPNQRVAAAAAARAGLPVVGENPGPPEPQTGGTAASDSERDQLRHAPDYARGCGLRAFLFAFEDDLYTPRSGLVPGDYAAAVAGR